MRKREIFILPLNKKLKKKGWLNNHGSKNLKKEIRKYSG